jgi:hypothetical protein
VSKQTLINWSKELQAEIANNRAIELEQLQQQYFMTKATRISMLGDLLAKSRDEVLTRSMTDVPTDKLIALIVTQAFAVIAMKLNVDICLPRSPTNDGTPKLLRS